MGSAISRSYSSNYSAKNYPENCDYPTQIRQHEMLIAVEEFILLVIKYSDKNEGVWLLLTSILGQKYYRSFLASEGIDDILLLFQDISSIKAARSRIPSEDNIYQREITFVCAQNVNTSGIVGDLLREKLDSEVQMLNNGLSHDQCDKIVIKILDELVHLLAHHTFISFHRSKYYSRWRAIERSHAIAVKLEDSRKLTRMNSEFTFKTVNSLTRIIQKKVRSVSSPTDLALSAIAGIHESCATEVLDYNCGWLLSLLSASEVLPLSFFVCSADFSLIEDDDNDTICSTTLIKNRKEREGLEDLDFPILFVNKHFQKLNQVRASSVLGDSIIEILWGDGLNAIDVYQRLFGEKKSMSESTVEEIKLKKRDGTEFKNLIGIKPIYDNYGNLCYFIGLQIELEKEFSQIMNPTDLIYSWLGTLPGLILVEDD